MIKLGRNEKQKQGNNTYHNVNFFCFGNMHFGCTENVAFAARFYKNRKSVEVLLGLRRFVGLDCNIKLWFYNQLQKFHKAFTHYLKKKWVCVAAITQVKTMEPLRLKQIFVRALRRLGPALNYSCLGGLCI